MDVKDCAATRKRLIENNHADENTIFYLNHFSHFAMPVIYDELAAAIKGLDFNISYDGLEVEF